MTTVIDSLVVELGIDPSKFNAGQQSAMAVLRHFQQESEKGGKAIESQAKKTFDLLGNLKREAVAAAGLMFGGYEVKRFIDSMTSSDAAIGRLSHTINMSARELGAWHNVFKQIGSDAGGANAFLSGTNAMLQNLSIGRLPSAETIGVLNQFGFNPKNADGSVRSPGDYLIGLSEAVQRHQSSPARKANLLGLMQGMTPDAINLILEGPNKIRERLAEAQKTAPDDKAVEVAQKYQAGMAVATDTLARFGQEIVVATGALEKMTELVKWLASFKDVGGIADFINRIKNAPSSVRNVGTLGLPVGDMTRNAIEWFKDWRAGHPTAPGTTTGTTIGGLPPAPGPGIFDPGGRYSVEQKIRAAAIARGHDPDQAVKVYRSEGASNYVGDDGSSFGPFQLHYGGVSRKHPMTGLGDEFTRKTGLDARDPATVQQQIEFVMDHVGKNGWGAFHGWKGDPFAGIDRSGRYAEALRRSGRPTGPSSIAGASAGGARSFNIYGGIHVNAPQAQDAVGISRAIGPAIDRTVTLGAVETGAQ